MTDQVLELRRIKYQVEAYVREAEAARDEAWRIARAMRYIATRPSRRPRYPFLRRLT
jgi:hypothetical protein